ETADVLDAVHGDLLSARVFALGLGKETVVVVFTQLGDLDQRVVVAAVGRGRPPQQAGDAPAAIAPDFRPGAARFRFCPACLGWLDGVLVLGPTAGAHRWVQVCPQHAAGYAGAQE